MSLTLMTLTLWHNPRCSKSRQTLALLQQNGHEPVIRRYLEDRPNEAEIAAALTRLAIPAHKLLRTGEAEYTSLGLSPDVPEPDLIAAMAAHPRLIERPILFTETAAAIGRPPEAVLAIV